MDDFPSRWHRPTTLWSGTLWPVLAGAVTAAGVVGGTRTYGPLGFAALALGLWLLISVMVWAAFCDDGVTRQRAVRYGTVAAHALVTAIGVLILFPVAGWAVLLVWGLTSPLLTDAVARRGRGRRTAPPAGAAAPHPGARGDQAVVDRTFGEIVRGFHESA